MRPLCLVESHALDATESGLALCLPHIYSVLLLGSCSLRLKENIRLIIVHQPVDNPKLQLTSDC